MFNDMKQYLQRLIAGETLSRQDTHNILVGITRETYPAEQIAALLMAFLVMQLVEGQRQRAYFEMREHPHATNPDIQEVVVATPLETPDSIR